MSFPIFFDEHVQAELADLLKRIDCDVLTVRDAGKANARLSDEDVLALATAEGRALFTYNAKDFVPIARLWAADGRNHEGIILSEQRPARELYPRFLVLFEQYPDGIPNLFLRLPPLPLY